jgi:hypothetical protein
VSGGNDSQYPLTVAISSSTVTIPEGVTTSYEIQNTDNTLRGSVDFTGLDEGLYTIMISPIDGNGCVKTVDYYLDIETSNVEFTAGEIISKIEVCEGATMPTITQTTPANGNGTLEFKWFEIVNGVEIEIEGEDLPTYRPSNHDNFTAGTTYVYTRKVKDQDPCNIDADGNEIGFVSSGSCTLTVNTKPTNVRITQPEDQSNICGGTDIILKCSAELTNLPEGQVLSYKWTKNVQQTVQQLGTDINYTINDNDANGLSSGKYVFTATSTYKDGDGNVVLQCSASADVL